MVKSNDLNAIWKHYVYVLIVMNAILSARFSDNILVSEKWDKAGPETH